MTQLTPTEFFPSTFLNETSVQHSLGEDFTLCDNGNVVFHWADYHETCDTIKIAIDTNSDLRNEFARKEVALTRLSLIPVWIRTNKKVHQTTMFELYERSVLNNVQYSLGINPFGPIEISFISSTGPFKSMVIAECFNRSTYKDFVMVYLLKDKLPKRDYRIRLKSKVLMEYGKDFSKAGLIGLEQLTMNGILFSLDSDEFINYVSKETEMRILIDSTTLENAAGKDLQGLKEYLSQYAFNLLYSSRLEDAISCQLKDFSFQSSFDFFKDKKIYLFITYEKLANNSQTSIRSIKEFVGHTRSLIREHYNSNLLIKSA